MTDSSSALPLRAQADLNFTYDDRHWRVRGLEKQLSCERLKVNLMVARRELVHVDTLDLYAARMRRMFIKEAAAELYVEEATIKQDLQWANRLASEALGARLDTLLPQTSRLLVELQEYVARRAEEEAISRGDVRFTQRQLREALQWSDRALRRQLARLVELEYVLTYRTGRGNQRAYQLLYDDQVLTARRCCWA